MKIMAKMASQSLKHLTELLRQPRPMLMKVRPPLAHWSWLAGRGPEKQVEKARPRNFQITIETIEDVNLQWVVDINMKTKVNHLKS